MKEIEVRIPNLSALDVDALQRATGKPLKTEPVAAKSKQSRELVTLVVIGGIGVVSAAAAYYFGKKKSEEIEIEIEARDNDGAYRRVTLKLKRQSNEPVDTQIMSQIGAVLGKGAV